MPKKLVIPDNFSDYILSYQNKEASIGDIAKELDVVKSTVLKWFNLFDVKRYPAGVLISKKLRGRPGHRLGKKHSEKTKEKLRQASIGKAKTLGFKFSEESKEKMRESAKRRIQNTNALEKMRQGKEALKLPDAEKIARKKARDACKRMLRRILTMSRIRKDAKTEVLLGYSKEELRIHLEAKFQPGMSWAVRDSFHIDHIKPVAQFFREGVFDPAIINSLENLQVLTPEENRKKGDSFSDRNRRQTLIIDKNGTRSF